MIFTLKIVQYIFTHGYNGFPIQRLKAHPCLRVFNRPSTADFRVSNQLKSNT